MVDADFDTELDSLPRLIADAAEPLPDIAAASAPARRSASFICSISG